MSKPHKNQKERKHSKAYRVKPKSDGQKDLQECLNDETIRKLAITGPPGSGKTLLCCQKICDDFKAGKYTKIVLCRSLEPVSLEKTSGFMPGDKKAKLMDWMEPALQHIRKFLPDTDELIRSDTIELAMLDKLRGRSIDKCAVICIEAQNISIPALKCLMTRMHHNSMLVLDGDLDQGDRAGSELYEIYEKLQDDLDSFEWVELDRSDIMRDKADIPIVLDVFKHFGY